MIRISHYRIKCIGCNYCVEVAPSNWVMDNKDGKSTLLEASVKKGIHISISSDDDFDANVEAADVCPVNIIKVEKI